MGKILESREQEKAKHFQACKRVPVAKWLGLIPAKWIERLEQDQKLPSCCRHPENHKIEAWFSSETDRQKGIPDIYIFICEEQHELAPAVVVFEEFDLETGDGIPREVEPAEIGEAWHRRFTVGGGKRPFWETR